MMCRCQVRHVMGRCQVRCHVTSLLTVRHSVLLVLVLPGTLCGRERTMTVPLLCNALSSANRNANSFSSFKAVLKTHLFRDSFITLLQT